MRLDSTRDTAPANRRRWLICGLLFVATGINYVDRQMIGLLKPTLQGEFGFDEIGYGNIVFWFQAAYAIGYLSFGAIIDRLGARLGYACAFGVWTIAHMLHAAVQGVTGFAAVRFLLGLGESGNFPAGLKAVAEWFPAEERAFATGIFNAGSNIGAIVTPLVVPAITLAFGWRAAFLVTGLVSLPWLAAWLWSYRLPRRRGTAAAVSTVPPTRLGWRTTLRLRATWGYAVAKFMTDPIWWLFLFWLPDFLHRRHGLDLKSFGPPLVVIYLLSDIGSVAGGWLSSRLMRAGQSANRARKTAMLIAALAVTPIMAVQWIDGLWPAVLLIGLAAAAHQAWSANLMTLPSDMVPQTALGSVIGIGGAAGAVGGMVMTQLTGHALEQTGSYQLIFLGAGSVYLIALALLQLIVPRIGNTKESLR
jgi:ACS family hexuronate transporter-like MFS transporter|uniref:MFS transporter n=1 Tax=uncultured Sphingomonas sp. TaxID=158754 RepID=UPI0035CB90AA